VVPLTPGNPPEADEMAPQLRRKGSIKLSGSHEQREMLQSLLSATAKQQMSSKEAAQVLEQDRRYDSAQRAAVAVELVLWVCRY